MCPTSSPPPTDACRTRRRLQFLPCTVVIHRYTPRAQERAQLKRTSVRARFRKRRRRYHLRGVRRLQQVIAGAKTTERERRGQSNTKGTGREGDGVSLILLQPAASPQTAQGDRDINESLYTRLLRPSAAEALAPRPGRAERTYYYAASDGGEARWKPVRIYISCAPSITNGPRAGSYRRNSADQFSKR